MNKFFGFAISDSMFDGDLTVFRKTRTAEEVKKMADDGVLTPCLNPSHQATIDAMRQRFGIEVEIPEKAPVVKLEAGDGIVVMGVRGLPRLGVDRHEFTEEEIASATFTFSEWTVMTEDQQAQALGFADAQTAWAAMMHS